MVTGCLAWSAAVFAGYGDVSVIGPADLDGDRKDEVVAVGRPGTPVAGQVYVGKVVFPSYPGALTLSWVSPSRMLDDGSQVLLGDVDGDGRTDLVAVGAEGGGAAGWVVVGRSNGTGFDQWSWTSRHRMIDPGAKVWLADVNGDGRADLVSVGAEGRGAAGWVVVGLSDGSGFAHWSWASGRRMISPYGGVYLADVDGDGKSDLVSVGSTWTSTSGWVYVALSDGLGFGPQPSGTWSWTSGHRMIDDDGNVWVADVDGDRKADLVAQGTEDGPVPGWVVVGLSDGRGFAHWSWVSGTRMLEAESESWVLDWNNDKRADLISQSHALPPSKTPFYVGLSNGSGFDLRIVKFDFAQPVPLSFPDYNADGMPDVLAQFGADYVSFVRAGDGFAGIGVPWRYW